MLVDFMKHQSDFTVFAGVRRRPKTTLQSKRDPSVAVRLIVTSRSQSVGASEQSIPHCRLSILGGFWDWRPDKFLPIAISKAISQGCQNLSFSGDLYLQFMMADMDNSTCLELALEGERLCKAGDCRYLTNTKTLLRILILSILLPGLELPSLKQLSKLAQMI